jgi:hypothetical protein
MEEKQKEKIEALTKRKERTMVQREKNINKLKANLGLKVESL